MFVKYMFLICYGISLVVWLLRFIWIASNESYHFGWKFDFSLAPILMFKTLLWGTILWVFFLIIIIFIWLLLHGVLAVSPWFRLQYENGNMPFYIAGITGVILMLRYKEHKLIAGLGVALIATAFGHWIGVVNFPK
jgi:hypothetical protein